MYKPYKVQESKFLNIYSVLFGLVLNFLYSAVTSMTNIGTDATKPYGKGNAGNYLDN